jgi:hypothetical protein
VLASRPFERREDADEDGLCWPPQSQGQARWRATEGLDLDRLIEIHTTASVGGFRYSPTTSEILSAVAGSAVPMNVLTRRGLERAHATRADAQYQGTRPSCARDHGSAIA